MTVNRGSDRLSAIYTYPMQLQEPTRRQTKVVLEPPPSHSDHVAVQLRDAIVAGHLRPGQRLIETQLAEQLGLSRGPVREALKQLNREGLVEIRANRGAVVASFGPEDVLEIYAIRATLGSLALRQLILGSRVSPAVLESLRRLAQKARTAGDKGNQISLVRFHLEFQTAIASASGLMRVASEFRALSAELQMFINALHLKYPDINSVVDELDQLLSAIAGADLARAERVWRGMFRSSIDEFLELMPGGIERIQSAAWLVSVVEDGQSSSSLNRLRSPRRKRHKRPRRSSTAASS
jgi:DNA-binding GntR family transcriptional regulator